jgi:4-hydroxy-tetrahydrodipicolinate synthase
VVKLIGLLDGYSLMPALKGIMAMLSGEPGWLRARAPLVALTADEFAALEKTIREFGIDPESD